MLIEKTAWPQNKTCAAMISVNLDAEFFGKIYYPDVNVDEGDILRLGRTSLRYGLPKLLEVLDRYEVKATFFIPGAVVKRYPEAVASIVSRGHEIGCHGNNHEILAHMTADEQREALMEARELLTEAAGKAPLGFRMPGGRSVRRRSRSRRSWASPTPAPCRTMTCPTCGKFPGCWSCPSTGSCSTCPTLCSPLIRRSLRDSPAARGWTTC